MKKIVPTILAVFYVFISVIATILLFSFNDYRVSVYDDKSVVINSGHNNINNYKRGSILFIKNNKDEIKINDTIFYYNTYANKIGVKDDKVKKIHVINETEKTIELDNGNAVSIEYVIGNTDNIKIIPVFGYLLWVLESRWGYLLLVILPILILFIFGIYELIKRLKDNKRVDNVVKVKNGKRKK